MADFGTASTMGREQSGTRPGMPGTKESAASAGIVDTIKEKAKDLACGAGEMMSGAKDKVQEWAADAADVAGQVKDKAQEYATTAAHKAEDVGRGLTDLIRQYPMPALLVGFGLGFLVAQLTTRRS